MQGAPVFPPAGRPPSLPLLRIAALLRHEHHRHLTARPSAAAAGRDGPRRCCSRPGAGPAAVEPERGAVGGARRKLCLKRFPPSGEAGGGAAAASVMRRDAAARGAARAEDLLYARAAEKRLCTQRRLEALVRGLCHPLAISASRPWGFAGREPCPPFRGFGGFSLLFLFCTTPDLVGQQWESRLQ